MCRYLEKVVPSPYGPQLPWHFPLSRSFWLSGDVTEGPVVMPILKRLLSRLPWRKTSPQQQAYEQVQILCMSCWLLPWKYTDVAAADSCHVFHCPQATPPNTASLGVPHSEDRAAQVQVALEMVGQCRWVRQI